MDIIKHSELQRHNYNNGSVQVAEFNFTDHEMVNDAEITINGRYPKEGYAVNAVSHALISVESGSAFFTLKNQEAQLIEKGDRLLIKPGEPYAFNTEDVLSIRYIAIPAWKAEQSRIIN